MKTKKRLNLKPHQRKSDCWVKLTVARSGKQFAVYATNRKRVNLPVEVGSLQQVISQAEYLSAHYSLPVEHDLNQPLKLIVQIYRQKEDAWIWVGRRVVIYPDADVAYLEMRKLGAAIDQLALVKEGANVKRAYTCSQNCIAQWATILHRLQNHGQVSEWRDARECSRCFSQFVKSLEGGEAFCLNCGHEKPKD